MNSDDLWAALGDLEGDQAAQVLIEVALRVGRCDVAVGVGVFVAVGVDVAVAVAAYPGSAPDCSAGVGSNRTQPTSSK